MQGGWRTGATDKDVDTPMSYRWRRYFFSCFKLNNRRSLSIFPVSYLKEKGAAQRHPNASCF